MQTARAIVSSGRLACARIDWMSGMEGSVREVLVGMRFLRCTAGPA